MIDWPSWDDHDGDVIQYAAAFDLYFRLSAKRGENHNQFTRSILFLKEVTARNLMKIVEPLLIAIEGLQSDFEDIGGTQIGFLPHHLHVNALAQWIAEQCKTEPFDRDLSARPRVHNLSYGDEIANPAEDTDGDASRYAEPLNGHIQGYLAPTIAQAWRPNGLPGRQMPTHHTRESLTPCNVCTPINLGSPVMLAVRRDTLPTRAIFWPCRFSFNDT
jgi:hypothetical protein